MQTSSATATGVKIKDCLWIRSGIMDESAIFRSLRKALVERDAQILTLNGPKDEEGLEKIRKKVWSCDTHVIMDCMMPHELRRLYPVFKERRNFSMSMVDWWTSRHWFTRNSHFLIFRNYNGISVRRGLGPFADGRQAPLLALPEKLNFYAVASSLLRGPGFLAAPFLEMWHDHIRQLENIPVERLLYFPFTVLEEHVPIKEEPAKYDFCNVSANGGYWFMRDPYASSWLNWGNLYYDRLRLTKGVSKAGNGRYRVFDLRKSHYLNWEEYMRVVHGSRFAIATGGLHQNSVAKYTEFACLGTPMIGEDIPFEYPWLSDCLYHINADAVAPKELEAKLEDALEQQPKLRANCLNARDTILKLYHPHRVLDMLQDQMDGKPLPPGYLKPAAEKR